MPPAKRVASMIASSTEIVCALGRGDWLVGRSHECDYPDVVRALPVCTEPKLNILKRSAAIDAEVKDLLRQAVSIYRVDAERLRALKPDVIVTQSQCEVCAVSEQDVAAALADWLGAPPRVVSLQPDRLDDIRADIRKVGTALDAVENAEKLITDMDSRIAAVRAAPRRSRPRTACVEWLEPLMAAGNWVPELVELAGGENLFGEAGKHSPELAWDSIKEADPDVVVLMPCGFDIARTRRELPALTRLPGWAELTAVRAGRVYLVDGNAYFNRPGPRVVDSLEILGEILHLDKPGTAGRGWERL